MNASGYQRMPPDCFVQWAAGSRSDRDPAGFLTIGRPQRRGIGSVSNYERVERVGRILGFLDSVVESVVTLYGG